MIGSRAAPGRRARVLLVAVTCALTVVSCSEPEPATPPGRFADQVDLTGQTFTVTGREFAEQRVLCRMTIALLQSARATTVDACDVEGSGAVRSALVDGRADMYWEYTGTAWRTYLGQDAPISDPDDLFAAVRDADDVNDIAWLTRTPFSNSYAVGVRTDTAQRLGVRTLSDWARLAAARPPEATLCVDQEFTGREDGLRGLSATYGFELEAGALSTRLADEIYPALVAGSPCVFGEVSTTDGRINALRLTTLVDDRRYFPPYNAALTVRRDVLDRSPRLALLARSLAPTLTDSVIRVLNERVSVGRRDPDEVARSYLREQGLIG